MCLHNRIALRFNIIIDFFFIQVNTILIDADTNVDDLPT